MRALYIILVFLGIAFLLVVWSILDLLATPILYAFWLLVAGLGVIVVYIAGRGLLRLVREMVNVRHEIKLNRFELAQAEREAHVQVDIAPAGSQIVRTVTGHYEDVISEPLHLAPGRVNGRPSAFADDEIERWTIHQMASNKLKAGQGNVPMLEAPEPLRPVLEILPLDGCIMNLGPRGSGKTNAMKHQLVQRASIGDVILIDPNSPSKLAGFDVCGAGHNWPEIRDGLLSVQAIGEERFSLRTSEFQQFPHLSVFVDEWFQIIKALPDAADILLKIVHGFRGVSIDLILATQDMSVKSMGIEGQSAVRKAFTVVEYFGYKGRDHRVTIHPDRDRDADGNKLRPVEYRPPPKFIERPIEPEQVFTLPNAQILKAQAMHDAGESMTQIAKAYFELSRKPSGKELQTVRELLERAEYSAKTARK